eukprot:TRINITY_DN1507_c0_g2_i1.p1 TRINITY_DN1507_c0_g2~~TRINITY_DN1507_c0_g2_i1.p1  ORF type:complete len:329 (-),score=81.56 TRINITY_DN1507_c0_g2_i1:184-1170(-)
MRFITGFLFFQLFFGIWCKNGRDNHDSSLHFDESFHLDLEIEDVVSNYNEINEKFTDNEKDRVLVESSSTPPQPLKPVVSVLNLQTLSTHASIGDPFFVYDENPERMLSFNFSNADLNSILSLEQTSLEFPNVESPSSIDPSSTSDYFIWVATNTAVLKINTLTDTIVGKYMLPGFHHDIAVSSDGGVWVLISPSDSPDTTMLFQIGLQERNQCIDRDDDGIINTSTGEDDVKIWDGDECIIDVLNFPFDDAVSISNFYEWGFIDTSSGEHYVINGGEVQNSFHGGIYGALSEGIYWTVSDETVVGFDMMNNHTVTPVDEFGATMIAG